MRQPLLQACLLSAFMTSISLFGQNNPIPQYIEGMNSFVPVAPEAAQIMKYVDYPVNYFTGTTNISIPIYTVNGKGIEVPIAISYHSGGGIKVNEVATSIGLGWNLFAGGEITREVRGHADEGGTAGSAFGGSLHTWPPIWSTNPPIHRFVDTLIREISTNSMSSNTFWHLKNCSYGYLDLEPDMYYFSFTGTNGKFMYNSAFDSFMCTERQAYIVKRIVGDNAWRITTEDGTQYYFNLSDSVVTQTKNDCISMQSSNWTTAPKTESSWKLSKIVNADGTDSIMFYYNKTREYRYYTAGPILEYNKFDNNHTNPEIRNNQICFTNNKFTGALELKHIVSNHDSIIFVPQSTERLDMKGGYALSKIIVKSREDNIVKNIFRLNYAYFSRPDTSGPYKGGEYGKQYDSVSLKLVSLVECGNSESNPDSLKHTFTYNATKLPFRLSFAQDIYGYANNNYTNSLSFVPPIKLKSGAVLPGANRTFNLTKAQAAILERIDYPTGGYATFEYEAHSLPPGLSGVPTTTKQIMAGTIKLSDTFQFEHYYYSDTFVIDQIPHPDINDSNVNGGVKISVITMCTHDSLLINFPVYQIINTSNSIAARTYNSDTSLSNLYLGNGSYVLRISGANTLNSFYNDYPGVIFRVSYKEIDTTNTQGINSLGRGLRIKSITSSDNKTGRPKYRNFSYHDTTYNVSHGMLMIPERFHQFESSFASASAYGNLWLTRSGHNLSPSGNYNGSSIVYPKVLETVHDVNGKKIRTHYKYSISIPSYPSVYMEAYPEHFETMHGNLVEKMDYVYHTYYNLNIDNKKESYTYMFPYMAPPQLVDTNMPQGVKVFFKDYGGALFNYTNPVTAVMWLVQVPHYQIYQTDIRPRLLSKKTITDISGTLPGITTDSVCYEYETNYWQPIKTTNYKPNGDTLIDHYIYPHHIPPAYIDEVNTYTAQQMISNNRVGMTLGHVKMNRHNVLTKQFMYPHFDGKKFLIDSIRTSTVFNPLEKEVTILSYDSKANPLSMALRGGKYRNYKWQTGRNLALSSSLMQSNGNYVFTSFEYADEYSWNDAARTNAMGAFAGEYIYNLNGNPITISGFTPTGRIDVFAWIWGNSLIANSVNGEYTGRSKGVWKLYKINIPAASSVTVSCSGSVLIDQLVIVPEASSFVGNVYDRQNRIVARTTEGMQTQFYEYDHFGRLLRIKDESGKIIKDNQYAIQGNN